MNHALIIGNSDGIGLALTKSLLADGWQVTGISRSSSPVTGPQHQHHVLDVCDPGYSLRLKEIVDQRGVPTVCVYCVGIGELLNLGAPAEAMAHALSRDRRVFEANLLGAVATAEVIIPAMLRVRQGHFIGLSSQADALVDPMAPSYAASKAGLSSYLEGIALACRPRGVHVTNVRFGFVDTKMAKAPIKPFMVPVETAAQRIRHCMKARPMRYTFPKRMAALVWLLQLRVRLQQWFA